MSHRGVLMPVRLTDLVAAPPSRATNFKVALAALVLVATAFSSVAMVHFAAPGSGGAAVLWREISWPFPRDGWPAGRAFRCEAYGNRRTDAFGCASDDGDFSCEFIICAHNYCSFYFTLVVCCLFTVTKKVTDKVKKLLFLHVRNDLRQADFSQT